MELSARQRYWPYGQMRYADGTPPTTYSYTGQREASATGGLRLLDYGARSYAPFTGRFISPDTLVPEPGNPQSLNRYAYVTNNPLRYTDPSGHYTFEEDPLESSHGWDARVRSRYWYTHPNTNQTYANDEDVLLAFASPLVAVVEALGATLLESAPAVVDAAVGWGLTHPTEVAVGKAVVEEALEARASHTPFNPGNVLLDLVTQVGDDIAPRGWHPGDPINAPTRSGDYPSWSTVRRRYWINEALNNPGGWSEENLARMRQGLAPQDETGASVHLHHINGRNILDPHNWANLMIVSPREHYQIHHGGR